MAHQFAEQIEGYAVVDGHYRETVAGGVHCGHLLEAQGHADCVQGDVECAVFGVAVFVELGLVGDVVVFGDHVEDEAFVATVTFPAFEDFEGGGRKGREDFGVAFGLELFLFDDFVFPVDVVPFEGHQVGDSHSAGVEGEKEEVKDFAAALVLEAGLDVVELLKLFHCEIWDFCLHFVILRVVFGFADFEVVLDDAVDVSHFDDALIDGVFYGVVEGNEGFVDAFFADVFLDFEAVGDVFVEDFRLEVAEEEGGLVEEVFYEVFEGVDVFGFVVPGAVAVFFFAVVEVVDLLAVFVEVGGFGAFFGFYRLVVYDFFEYVVGDGAVVVDEFGVNFGFDGVKDVVDAGGILAGGIESLVIVVPVGDGDIDVGGTFDVLTKVVAEVDAAFACGVGFCEENEASCGDVFSN